MYANCWSGIQGSGLSYLEGDVVEPPAGADGRRAGVHRAAGRGDGTLATFPYAVFAGRRLGAL